MLVTNNLPRLGGEAFKLSKQYADLDSVIQDAVSEYVEG
jgi:ketopantoate hydroxymethyltransferase